MAKKRKTRQEKIIADLRHNFTHIAVSQTNTEIKLENSNSNLIINSAKKIQSPAQVKNAYPYLAKDLSKTAFLTAGVLTFQILFYILLVKHLIMIPGLNY